MAYMEISVPVREAWDARWRRGVRVVWASAAAGRMAASGYAGRAGVRASAGGVHGVVRSCGRAARRAGESVTPTTTERRQRRMRADDARVHKIR